jgi:hypothetical protein
MLLEAAALPLEAVAETALSSSILEKAFSAP